MDLLKDQYFQTATLKKLAHEVANVVPDFKLTVFLKAINRAPWVELELMDRMRKVTDCLRSYLPDDYVEALKVLREVAPHIEGFDNLIFPDFVQRYGVDFPDESVPALEQFTELCSSEFAVRPFIERYPSRMFKQLKRWAKSPNMHHRRLASEGCRPRLPWATALKSLKQDPSPIFPVLELLKADSEDYVRRSVANNLNDISKDHPETVIKRVTAWQGSCDETDWIIKQACRTLLKQGRPDVLQLFGFAAPSRIIGTELEFDRSKVEIGQSVQFSCSLRTGNRSLGKLRLEYLVYFIKSNGQLSPKVFQISERLESARQVAIKKRHSFKDLSTRRHFPGIHRFEVRVNGVTKAAGSVKLS
ncbi:MAG: DNA alkylation repair protein [Verrucomicrobia bacterium]|nr:DNA alkylation repair protein [Verrucomicrobiota bacterium]